MKNLISTFAICALCTVTAAYADDEANLNQAIRDLNALAKSDADKKLVLNAVSQQTKVPEKTLSSHMGTTRLNYGELLTAESLAAGSKKGLDAVINMKHGKGWSDLSKEVKIDPNSIVARLRAAEKTVKGAKTVPKQAGSPKKAGANPNSVPTPPPPMPSKGGGY